MNAAGLAALPAERSTTPRVDAVVEQIVMAIHKGRVAPGDVLPGQRRLAEQLGVSRPTIRAAVDILESRGVLIRGGRGRTAGARVLSRPEVGSAPQELDAEPLAAVLEARRALEIGVAGLAALRASPKQIADMEEILEAHGAALAARRDGRALEREFHRRLWRAADNPSAERILNELELHIEDRSRLASDLTVLRHHEATLRALVLRFDVAVVMAQHLQHEDASRLGDA